MRRYRNRIIRYRITEVEVYDGFKDRASHASKGQTMRNAVMFGEAGRWYVYLVYGMHWMLNVVTREVGYPAAILIRGVEGVSGPGRVTKKLNIRKFFYGKYAHPDQALWFEYGKFAKNDYVVVTTPRIGVTYAGPLWSKKKWRFELKKRLTK